MILDAETYAHVASGVEAALAWRRGRRAAGRAEDGAAGLDGRGWRTNVCATPQRGARRAAGADAPPREEGCRGRAATGSRPRGSRSVQRPRGSRTSRPTRGTASSSSTPASRRGRQAVCGPARPRGDAGRGEVHAGARGRPALAAARARAVGELRPTSRASETGLSASARARCSAQLPRARRRHRSSAPTRNWEAFVERFVRIGLGRRLHAASGGTSGRTRGSGTLEVRAPDQPTAVENTALSPRCCRRSA